MVIRRILACAGVTVAVGSVASAQEPARDPVVATAAYVRTNTDLRDIGGADLVLDRRVADVTGKLTTPRPRDDTNAILRALGATRMGMQEQEVLCTGDAPKECRMRAEVRGVVALSAPRIEGDKASVDVHLWWESGSTNDHVASRQLIVDLERVNGAWRVKGNRPLRIN